MKPGIYQVRGNDHGEHTALVDVRVTVGEKVTAGFVFEAVAWTYTPRRLSPFPERLQPTRTPMVYQATARSIALAAFKAAQEAADNDAIEAAKVAKDDEIDTIGLDEWLIAHIGAGGRLGATEEKTS